MNDSQLLQQADRCVKCGLCLAVCPTYALRANEADSPRGRIALIQGMLTGDLDASTQLEAHLRGCLHCLNCAKACPSAVEYSLIIDAGLERLPKKSSWRLDQLSRWGQRPWLQQLARGLNLPGLHRLAEGLSWGSWRRLLELLPQVARPLQPGPAVAGPVVRGPVVQGQTALFLGCIGQLNDSPAQHALVRLCAALQIPLSIPPGQGCCGALHRHQGFAESSEPLRQANRQAFVEAGPILSLSSGCGAELRQQFGDQLEDASAFIARQTWPAGLTLQPLAARVALHSPCSLRNGLGTEQAVWRLLQRIPEIQLLSLENSLGCCGGAGLQLIEQPQLADQLAEPLLEQIERLRPDFIVTSNSGCALHLRRALRLRGMDMPLLHPIELVARQLPWSTMAANPSRSSSKEHRA
ncbi:MAG: (Fe-S)-binding protein [Gammaproteobacteria bacterium]|nr:(Fe-S)-binding protein [Gammaproteobacteria bacterium]